MKRKCKYSKIVWDTRVDAKGRCLPVSSSGTKVIDKLNTWMFSYADFLAELQSYKPDRKTKEIKISIAQYPVEYWNELFDIDIECRRNKVNNGHLVCFQLSIPLNGQFSFFIDDIDYERKEYDTEITKALIAEFPKVLAYLIDRYLPDESNETSPSYWVDYVDGCKIAEDFEFDHYDNDNLRHDRRCC